MILGQALENFVWFLYSVVIILALITAWIIVQLRMQYRAIQQYEEVFKRFPVLRWQLWQIKGEVNDE